MLKIHVYSFCDEGSVAELECLQTRASTMNHEDFLQPVRTVPVGASGVAENVASEGGDSETLETVARNRSMSIAEMSEGTEHQDGDTTRESGDPRKRRHDADDDVAWTESQDVSPMSYGSSPTFHPPCPLPEPYDPRALSSKKLKNSDLEDDPDIAELQRQIKKAELEVQLKMLREKLEPGSSSASLGGYRPTSHLGFGGYHHYRGGQYSDNQFGEAYMDCDPQFDDVGLMHGQSPYAHGKVGFPISRVDPYSNSRGGPSRFQTHLAITNQAPVVGSRVMIVEHPMEIEASPDVPNVNICEVSDRTEVDTHVEKELGSGCSLTDSVEDSQIQEDTLNLSQFTTNMIPDFNGQNTRVDTVTVPSINLVVKPIEESGQDTSESPAGSNKGITIPPSTCLEAATEVENSVSGIKESALIRSTAQAQEGDLCTHAVDLVSKIKESTLNQPHVEGVVENVCPHSANLNSEINEATLIRSIGESEKEAHIGGVAEEYVSSFEKKSGHVTGIRDVTTFEDTAVCDGHEDAEEDDKEQGAEDDNEVGGQSSIMAKSVEIEERRRKLKEVQEVGGQERRTSERILGRSSKDVSAGKPVVAIQTTPEAQERRARLQPAKKVGDVAVEPVAKKVKGNNDPPPSWTSQGKVRRVQDL